METIKDKIAIETLSYEEARDELVSIIREMENGNLPLEDSLKLWDRGNALANHCQGFLDGAKAKLKEALDNNKHL